MRVGFVKMHEEMAHLEIRFERRLGELIKWSFVFWLGAVGAIAALAGVLRSRLVASPPSPAVRALKRRLGECASPEGLKARLSAAGEALETLESLVRANR